MSSKSLDRDLKRPMGRPHAIALAFQRSPHFFENPESQGPPEERGAPGHHRADLGVRPPGRPFRILGSKTGNAPNAIAHSRKGSWRPSTFAARNRLRARPDNPANSPRTSASFRMSRFTRSTGVRVSSRQILINARARSANAAPPT